MTIKLVKRREAAANEEKPDQPPSSTQLMLTTQGWIDEFKARKATARQSLAGVLRRI